MTQKSTIINRKDNIIEVIGLKLFSKYVQAMSRLWFFVGVVFAIPIIVVTRLLRPLVLVRFGYFTADRIGHFVFDVEYYLTEEFTREKTERKVDLFFIKRNPANEQFSIMCSRHIFIRKWIAYLYVANKILFGGERHAILPARTRNASRDKKGIMSLTPHQLKFNGLENARGQSYLERKGLRKGDQYVCLIVRDSAYLEQSQGNRDWSYHNYRDTEIESYQEAVAALVENGYWVIRMGKVVHHALGMEHSMVIDYATSNDRCDFLDIWLVANCRFTISTGLGLDSVADAFRRPIVFVNYLPLMDLEAWGPYLTVPKHLNWMDSGKPLTLSEQIKHSSANADYYTNNRIEILDLKPEEIKSAVLEMESRLAGTWLSLDMDEDLNNKFWHTLRSHSEYEKYHGWVHPQARIGTDYLRNSREWLFT